MKAITTRSLLGAVLLAAALPVQAQFSYLEDFTSSPVTSLTLSPGSGQTTFSDTGGDLEINMTGGFEASYAFLTQSWANGGFTISADVVPSKMLFTSGFAGVFAYGNGAFDNSGYTARVRNVGFSADDFALDIVGPTGAVLATTPNFDLVLGFEDAYTTFTLSLSGTFSGPDLQLDAVLTPISDPNSIGVRSVGFLVTTPDLTSDQWGIRQIKAGNDFNIAYDNLSIEVASPIPEPAASAMLVCLIAVGLAGARRPLRTRANV